MLVGDSGVGKSSLLKQFSSREFKQEMKATIGISGILKGVQRIQKESTFNIILSHQTLKKCYQRFIAES